MKVWPVAFSLVLAAGPAIAAPDPTAIDRDHALTADVETLAREAFAAIAPRFVEVERPTFSGLLGPQDSVRVLRFATAAESAGWPGLCKATTAWIDLADPHAPIQTSTVYKAVGDLAPLPDIWNEAYGAELQRKCAEAGRVIPTESGDFGQAVFFSLAEEDRDHVWAASRALQIATLSAAAGAEVTCVEEPGYDAELLEGLEPDDPEVIEDRENRDGCRKAGATLAGLSLDRLQWIDITPCTNAEPGVLCVEAEFLRFAHNNRQVGWVVTLRFQEGPDRRGVDPMTVSGLALTPSWTVYD